MREVQDLATGSILSIVMQSPVGIFDINNFEVEEIFEDADAVTICGTNQSRLIFEPRDMKYDSEYKTWSVYGDHGTRITITEISGENE